jgi:hypothetical protein
MPRWLGVEMTKVGQNFERPMRIGESVEASLEKPKKLPPRPENCYTPVILPGQ